MEPLPAASYGLLWESRFLERARAECRSAAEYCDDCPGHHLSNSVVSKCRTPHLRSCAGGAIDSVPIWPGHAS